MIKGTTKRMIIMLLFAALVFGGIYGFQQFRNKMIQKAIKGQGMPPQAVSTIVAQTSAWQPSVEAVGNLRAASGANLAAEVGGLVTAIHFESGKTVKAGQLLVELNAGPLKAQLEQLKAAAALARQNYERDSAQLKVQAISQAAVDADAANLKSAQAQVAAQESTISQKYIRAPFSGKLSQNPGWLYAWIRVTCAKQAIAMLPASRTEPCMDCLRMVLNIIFTPNPEQRAAVNHVDFYVSQPKFLHEIRQFTTMKWILVTKGPVFSKSFAHN